MIHKPGLRQYFADSDCAFRPGKSSLHINIGQFVTSIEDAKIAFTLLAALPDLGLAAIRRVAKGLACGGAN